MGAAELFEHATRNFDGRFVRGFTARCGRCGAEQFTPFNTMKGGASADAKQERNLSRLFQEKHWKVGSSAGQHRCPSCFAAARRAQANRRAGEKVVDLRPAVDAPPAEPVAAEPARTMSLEDRRVIFAKLNDLYVNPTEGYQPGWSDQKVAVDLGVPRDWVAEIRDQNFGPDTNAELRAALDGARSAISDQTVALEQLTRELAVAQGEIQRIASAVADVQRAVSAATDAVAAIEGGRK